MVTMVIARLKFTYLKAVKSVNPKVLTKQQIPRSLVDVKAVCVLLRNRGNASSLFYMSLACG